MQRYSKFHTYSAWLLVAGGCWWAVLLLSAMVWPIAGLVYNLIYAPGWAIFFGWWKIASGDPTIKNIRLFWALSILVNLVYYIVHLEPWETYSSFERSLDSRGIWWLITVAISLACTLTKPAEQGAAGNPLPAE